ncbi:hypothetical protein [Urbifossiella limnaea]|uniref:Uncharacterized protein n=1 Tax=Urbifossiella limnaea TaxID=2528023 RepID=A0A517XL01_9BACT|nr:hypothetical protein [Urbifossiella limnaea]QDU18188.1 hypothetical protein ETAA1_00710 [Urbifossiella limnaea]
MYHVFEHPTAADRLAVLSDDDWRNLSAEQRTGYTLRRGGFRTALDAVLAMLDLAARLSARCRRPHTLLCH